MDETVGLQDRPVCGGGVSYKIAAPDVEKMVRSWKGRKVMVSVAQLVEPRIVIPVVVGSSPIVHPSFSAGAGR